MKKIISIFAFFPLISLAVELHSYDDCVSYKSNMVNIVDNFYSLTTDDNWLGDPEGYLNESLFWLNSVGENINLHIQNYDHDRFLSTSLQQLDAATNEINTFQTLYLSNLSTLSNSVYSLNCSECPASSTNATGCCDFTEIIQHIDLLRSKVELGNLTLSTIDNYVKTYFPSVVTNLQYLTFLTEHGFDNVTNQLIKLNDNTTNLLSYVQNILTQGFSITNILNSIYDVQTIGWGVATNYANIMYIPGNDDYWQYSSPQLLTTLSYPSYLSGNFSRFFDSLGFFNNADWQYSAFSYGLAPTYFLALQEVIGCLYAENAWTQYYHDYMYPQLTNTLTQIHTDTTNFFSFFRGEIGVQGVLSDWTPQQGAYYDFLTNHYLAIMRGDTLSANMSAKTNWFSRIETLLAALVFPDSQSTNVVDSSAYSEQQQAINSAISAVNSSAANSYHDFETSANSVISLYQMFAQNFDDVALPSRIVLFTLTNDDSSTEIVDFGLSDNPSLTAFVEGTRAVTTFCWASVGIFLLFKFMLWALRGIYLTILFVYKVISSVLH